MMGEREPIEIHVAPSYGNAGDGIKRRSADSLADAWSLAVIEAEKRPVSIVLGNGTYYLSETLRLAGRPSSHNPIEFVASPGARPFVSGSKRLELEWRHVDDTIYAAVVDAAEELLFDQLFVNRRRQIRARFPNGHPQSPLLENFAFIEGADEREYPYGHGPTDKPPLPHRELSFAPDTFRDREWEHPEDGIIHIFPRENWNALQFAIRGIDYKLRRILLGRGGFQQHERFAARPGTMLDRTSRFYIENIREELDAPGEWFFDRRTRELLYYPEDGVDIGSALIEVPQLQELIRVEGSEDARSHDVTFRGIRFGGTTTTYLGTYEPVSFGDWTIVRSGALVFRRAERCLVDDCFFDACGGNALFLDGYNHRITIQNSLITESGESGIAIVGESLLRMNDSYECAFCGTVHPWGFAAHHDEYPRECTIHNNLVHDIGTWGKQTAALFLAVTANNRISHNEFYNIPRAALCIHDGTFGGHLIEHNYMHHTCRETDEHGTFNSWGRDSWWCHAQSHGGLSHPAGDVFRDALFETVIRNNRFLDFAGWCIDLDDGSSHYDIYNNVSIGGGIKTREGDYRRVHNNVVYLPAIDKPTAIQVGNEDNSDVWYNNIIYAHHDCIHLTRPPERRRVVKHCDRNIYFSRDGEFRSRGMSLAEWRENGIDESSVFADPEFVDAAGGDFRVQRGSPARKLGFIEFPQDEFGLTDFPSTWRELEPEFPVYDYDTMNRTTLKNMRGEIGFAEARSDGAFVLDAVGGKTGASGEYRWRLPYGNGGSYLVRVVYLADEPAECELRAFVESIGSQELRGTLLSDSSVTQSTLPAHISLSGEATDAVEIAFKLIEPSAGFTLSSVLLVPITA